MLQRGRCFEQAVQYPCFDPPDAKYNVCCYPTRDELAPLAESLRGVTTVSVGAGAGWLEGLLTHAFGLRVVAVEIDVHAALSPDEAQLRYSSLPAFVSPILRVRGTSAVLDPAAVDAFGNAGSAVGGGAIFSAKAARDRDSIALLFCFGRRLPFEQYLRVYGTRVCIVAIIGDDDTDKGTCNTQPGPHELGESRYVAQGWERCYHGRMRSVPPAATLCIYRRSRRGACNGGQRCVTPAEDENMCDAGRACSSTSTSSSTGTGTREDGDEDSTIDIDAI